MKLKEWLQNENISASEFGRRIGVKHTAVLRWCSGIRTPRKAQIAAIQRATDGAVGPADFFAPHATTAAGEAA